MNGTATAARHLTITGQVPGNGKKPLELTTEERAALETVQSYLERVRRYRGKLKEELAVLEGWDP